MCKIIKSTAIETKYKHMQRTFARFRIMLQKKKKKQPNTFEMIAILYLANLYLITIVHIICIVYTFCLKSFCFVIILCKKKKHMFSLFSFFIIIINFICIGNTKKNIAYALQSSIIHIFCAPFANI